MLPETIFVKFKNWMAGRAGEPLSGESWIRSRQGVFLFTLMSLLFHLAVDYQSSYFKQVIGLVIIILSGILVSVEIYSLSRWRPQMKGAISRSTLPMMLLLVGACIVYLKDLSFYAVGSEEILWVLQLREILNGARVGPIGFKGDHPANFMLWPAVFIYPFVPNAVMAVRVLGVFYILGASLFSAKLVARFTKSSMAAAFVLSAFSLCNMHYSQLGWLEVAFGPLAASSQLYFFFKFFDRPSRLTALQFAISFAIGFSTLYTGFLFSIILLGLVIFMPSRIVSLYLKFEILLYGFLLTAPTIGKCIQYSALNRHVGWVAGGTELRYFSPDLNFPTLFIKGGASLINQILPVSDLKWALGDISLETTSFVMVLVGAVWLITNFRERKSALMLMIVAGLSIGLTLTHPQWSNWRVYAGYSTICFVLAGLGLEFLAACLQRRPLFKHLLLMSFLLVHVVLAGQRMRGLRWGDASANFGPDVQRVYEEVLPRLAVTEEIFVENIVNGWIVRAFNALLPRNWSAQEFRTGLDSPRCAKVLHNLYVLNSPAAMEAVMQWLRKSPGCEAYSFTVPDMQVFQNKEFRVFLVGPSR